MIVPPPWIHSSAGAGSGRPTGRCRRTVTCSLTAATGTLRIRPALPMRFMSRPLDLVAVVEGISARQEVGRLAQIRDPAPVAT